MKKIIFLILLSIFTTHVFAREELTPFLNSVEAISMKLAKSVGLYESSYGSAKERKTYELLGSLQTKFGTDFRLVSIIQLLFQGLGNRHVTKGKLENFPQSIFEYTCENNNTFSVYVDYYVKDGTIKMLGGNEVMLFDYATRKEYLLTRTTTNGKVSYISQDKKLVYFFDEYAGRLYLNDTIYYLGCQMRTGSYNGLLKADIYETKTCEHGSTIKIGYNSYIKNASLVAMNGDERILIDEKDNTKTIIRKVSSPSENALRYASNDDTIQYNQTRITDAQGFAKESIQYVTNNKKIACTHQN